MLVCLLNWLQNSDELFFFSLDPEMQSEIDTYIARGKAKFSVLLLVGLLQIQQFFFWRNFIFWLCGYFLKY